MSLPPPIDALWRELETTRTKLLKEVQGLSQAQSEWRAGAEGWSVGEILHHLTLAEVATGKLTSKLLKEAGTNVAPVPPDLTTLAPPPPWPAGPREAPPVVRPDRGQAFPALLAELRSVRERSRQNVERLAAVDPRPLTWRHFALGELNLAQWWMLQARHDADHLEQIRGVKASPGFPPA